jgi:cation diffusion facilitator CzcD-associated flavoprotein CzcO
VCIDGQIEYVVSEPNPAHHPVSNIEAQRMGLPSTENIGAQDLPEAVDVLIIGAGPHGLAMASRLLLGEEALQDCIALPKPKEPKEMKAHLDTERRVRNLKLAVVDANGTWMRRWKNQFEALGIEYLRSNDVMHPDAFAHTSLPIWAASNQRNDFLRLENLPSNFHGNFQAPSNQLMCDFCAHLVKAGHLEDHLFQADVESLEPCESGVNVTVNASKVEKKICAKHVVVARGPTWNRQWPSFYKALDVAATAQIQHAWDLFDDPERMNRIRGHGVIVGGGLTSAHLCAQLAKNGTIDLLIRRDRRVKQFDLDVSWMRSTRDRRQLRQKFEQASVEERVAINQAVRDGGSITPELNSVLSKLEAEGLLKVHEFTEIVSASWHGSWILTLGNGEVIESDYLVCATGTHVDISADPLLSNLQNIHPLRMVAGLPVLSEHLQWGELPIYLMGNAAAIELGPDAVNMTGAMRGAFRIWPMLMRKRCRKKGRAPSM